MSRMGFDLMMSSNEDDYEHPPRRPGSVILEEEAAASNQVEDQIQTIILFGTTGSGKSSVMNMLSCEPGSEQVAVVKNSARGVTSKAKNYTKVFHDKRFIVFDTPGMHEGAKGTVPMEEAISQFHQLLVAQKKGIHLIVLVMPGSRITTAEENNYHLIKYLCGDDVPLVIVFTKLENEEDVAGWWDRDEQKVSHSVFPNIAGHACVTTIRGKPPRHPFLPTYNASKERVELLIAEKALPGHRGCVIREHSAGSMKRLFAHIRQLREARLSSTDFHDRLALFLRSAYDLSIGAAVKIAYKVSPTCHEVYTL